MVIYSGAHEWNNRRIFFLLFHQKITCSQEISAMPRLFARMSHLTQSKFIWMKANNSQISDQQFIYWVLSTLIFRGFIKTFWNSPLGELWDIYLRTYIKRYMKHKLYLIVEEQDNTEACFYFVGLIVLCKYDFSRSWSRGLEISLEPTFPQTVNSFTTIVEHSTVVDHSFRLLLWPLGCLYHIK